MRLEVRGNHLTCKVGNKCLNVRERRELVDRSKDYQNLDQDTTA